MKSIKFIPYLIAAAAIFTASCSDDNDKTYLDEVKVSTSYVAIPQVGGATKVEITTDEEWTITCCETCDIMDEDHMDEKDADWLDIYPLYGEGSATVTFEADEALDGRSTEVFLHCGDKVQRINVIQGLSTVSPATCAEVIAGPEAKTYRVTGTVKSIANTTYGNWYLADETGEIYIYGTLDAKGATKNFLSLGLEVGDIVTVEGPKTLYGTTVELVDVTVVNIQKSLIKVEEVEDDGEFPLEGGDITAYLSCKGDGVSVEIPEEAKDWLSIKAITGGDEPTVTFHAAPNEGGDRGITVTFYTSSNGKTYTSETFLSQSGAIVTATCAEFLAAPVGSTQYRLTGVIQRVAKADYGNVYIRDYTGEAYVYGIGAKGDFDKLGLKEGDIVTVVGTRSAYKDSPQMAGGQYENHISVIDLESVTEFLAMPDSKDVYYRVPGVISSIANTTYGNLYMTDGENDVYVYGCYPGWGASGDFRKGWLGTAGIEEGDYLTMIGYKDTYNGTVELCGGIYFSHQKPDTEE